MTPTMSHHQHQALLETLEQRFNEYMHRHESVLWSQVQSAIQVNIGILDVIWHMESSGGEPDIVMFPNMKNKLSFVDCSAESPVGRRSFCYDAEALAARKQNKPLNSAVGWASQHGLDLLSEEQYIYLQNLGDFDLKTSSWIKTPPILRARGGALFGDKRYGRTFIYHNGAESYYGARGFRTLLLL